MTGLGNIARAKLAAKEAEARGAPLALEHRIALLEEENAKLRASRVDLHVVFDCAPNPDSSFVECETPDGTSVRAGEWRERPDGLWELVITGALPA